MVQVPTVLRVSDANRLLDIDHVRWMVSSGRWQRPVRGVVVRHSGPLTSDERIFVELSAQPPAAAVAGLTAACLDGLQGLVASTIFLTVPHNVRARPRAGVVVKRTLAWWEDMTRNKEIVIHEQKTLLRFAGFALRHEREGVAKVLLTFFATRGRLT